LGPLCREGALPPSLLCYAVHMVICPEYTEEIIAEHLINEPGEDCLEPGDWFILDNEFAQVASLSVKNGVVVAYRIYVFECWQA